MKVTAAAVLVVVLIYAALSGVTVGTDIRISTLPHPAYFGVGRIFTITCTFPRGLTFDHFMHPSDGIVSTSMGRFRVFSDFSTEISLEVSNAMESDGGPYYCVFTNGGVEEMSPTISALFREYLEQISPDRTETVAVGTDLNIGCDARHFNYRQWLRQTGGTVVPVSNSSDGRVVVTRDLQLRFRSLDLSDQGVYRCVINNELGNIDITADLTVVVPPVVTVNPDPVVVDLGMEARVECNITGVPLPRVGWRDTNNSNILVSRQGLQLETMMVNDTFISSVLTFSAVNASLAGPYTCFAETLSRFYTQSTAFIRLAGTPDPPSNVVLVVVNSTDIRVTWEAPNSEVSSYVVTWEAVNGSEANTRSFATSDPSEGTSYVITGLNTLTRYSVFIHATNSDGTGMNSPAVIITTSTTAPGAPRSVVLLDVGPNSVRVEWNQDTLSADDGGSPLRKVRLSFRVVLEGEEEPEEGAWQEAVKVDVGMGFAVIGILTDQTTYQIRMQLENDIGTGPATVSELFTTLEAGFPGSPRHVVAGQLEPTSAVVCWTESTIGKPFKYHVEVTVVNSDPEVVPSIFNFFSAESFPSIECSTGIKVSGLEPDTCYTFRVFYSNSLGSGHHSDPSPNYCTPSCEDGTDSTCTIVKKSAVLPTEGVAGVVVASVLLLAVVLSLVACVALRQYKKYSLKNVNLHYYSEEGPRRDSNKSVQSIQSAHSTTGLLYTHGSPGSFTHSPQISTSESSQDSPDTSTTIISSTDPNPFDFSKSSRPNQPVHHPQQPVLCPQGGPNVVEYPQGNGGVMGRSVSDQYPMYPILEDPPPYPHHPSCIYPLPTALSQPPSRGIYRARHYPPTATVPGHVTSEAPVRSGHMTTEGDMMMTDNPHFDEESGQHESSPSELDQDGGNRLKMLQTPRFGESYSQSGYSPVMLRSQEKTGSLLSNKSSSSSSTMVKNGVPEGGTEGGEKREEEDMEFMDNDAYETFAIPTRFKIVSKERGNVFETVKVK